MPSPSGHFEIGFEAQDHRLYPSLHERPLPPNLKSQVYSVSFYPAGQDSAVAVTYYTDIQDAPNSPFPTPPAQIARRILWSPNEDFAILPAEAWPHADSEAPAPAQAVSLRSSSVWQTADVPFPIQSMVWMDPLTAAGDYVDGCRHDVRKFDGRSGRMLPLQPADPPFGYKIRSADDGQLVMESVLGDCADAAQRRTFHPQCITYNVSFGRREIGACP